MGPLTRWRWWGPAGRRAATVGFVAAATTSCVLIARSPSSDQLADLDVYRGAAQTVAAGLPLYGFHAANGDPFTYPPFAALLLGPLAHLPFRLAGALWTAMTLAAVLALGRLLAHHGLELRRERQPAAGWWVALGLLVSAPGRATSTSAR